jgi:hypothetical protein
LIKNVLNEDVNNWASGNTIHSLIYAFILYFVFIIIARSRLSANILLFITLFLLYIINVHTTYLNRRNRISKRKVKKIRTFEKTLIIISFMIFMFGFIDYFLYKISIHGSSFDILRFLLGTVKCDYQKTVNMKMVEKLK